MSLITTPSLNTIVPLVPDAIRLKTIEHNIFPPPSIALLLPLIWVTHIPPFCDAPLFCFALHFSENVFHTAWQLLQYQHPKVPVPILHFAHFLHCSIPLSHFTLIMIFLRKKDCKQFVPSLLATFLVVRWTVPRENYSSASAPSRGSRPIFYCPMTISTPPCGYQTSSTSENIFQSQTITHPITDNPEVIPGGFKKKTPTDLHSLPPSLTAHSAHTAISTLIDTAQHPLPKNLTSFDGTQLVLLTSFCIGISDSLLTH